jgi:hypothetical protein
MPAGDTWTAIGAIGAAAGAVATAVGAFAVWWQISDAKSALYGTNSYALHKDLIDAYDHVLDAKDQLDQKGGQDPALSANLRRQVRRFDAFIQTAEGLHNNAGLSDDSWKQILSSMCPTFERDKYQIVKIDVPGVKNACDNGQKFWRVEAK